MSMRNLLRFARPPCLRGTSEAEEVKFLLTHHLQYFNRTV